MRVCRYSSHLLTQEDNEQVQKLNDSFRNGEVSVPNGGASLGGHAAADKSLKPRVSIRDTSVHSDFDVHLVVAYE